MPSPRPGTPPVRIVSCLGQGPRCLGRGQVHADHRARMLRKRRDSALWNEQLTVTVLLPVPQHAHDVPVIANREI